MEYLYHQTGLLFTTTDNDQLDAQIDEGFGDVDELVQPIEFLAWSCMMKLLSQNLQSRRISPTH